MPTREPPHNADLERAIFAVLLDGRSALSMQTVRSNGVEHPLFFFLRDHRIVYLACLELDDQGHRVDAQAVAELLSRTRFQGVVDKIRQAEILLEASQLDGIDREKLRELRRRLPQDDAEQYEDSALAAIGGFGSVTALMTAAGPVAGLERNVALLKDYFFKRRLIGRLASVVDKAFLTTDSFGQLIEESGTVLLDLGKADQRAEIHSMASTVDDTLARIQESINTPDNGIRTGIADLDKLMSLRPGGLYVLAARPGVGKTSFALKLVSHIVGHPDTPKKALFISLEVDRVDLLKKLLASESGIPFEKVERGQLLEPHELETLADTGKRMSGWTMDLMDVSDLTVHGLRAAVKRRRLDPNAGIDLLVIDYLQLLKESRPGMSEFEKVSEMTRVLKVMARDLGIPVLTLSQMSRDSEKGASPVARNPKLSDLRGSGTIEQDADAVVFLHRTDAGDGDKQEGPDAVRRVEVIVAKNRFGPQGKVKMHFHPAKMRFTLAAQDERWDEEGANDALAAPDGGPSRKERVIAQPEAGEDLF